MIQEVISGFLNSVLSTTEFYEVMFSKCIVSLYHTEKFSRCFQFHPHSKSVEYAQLLLIFLIYK